MKDPLLVVGWALVALNVGLVVACLLSRRVFEHVVRWLQEMDA